MLMMSYTYEQEQIYCYRPYHSTEKYIWIIGHESVVGEGESRYGMETKYSGSRREEEDSTSQHRSDTWYLFVTIKIALFGRD